MSEFIRDRIARFAQAEHALTPRQQYRCEQAGASGESAALVVATDCLYEEDEVGPEAAAELVDPDLADAFIATNQGLIALSSVVDQRAKEYPPCWVSTGNNLRSSPEQSDFETSEGGGAVLAGKPRYSALFTSWPGPGDDGMWRLYLDANRSISLFPLPWTSWFLKPEPGVRLLRVDSAREWCDLVSRYPIATPEGAQLDWGAFSRSFDALDITLRAVFATDGIEFLDRGRIVAPVRWDAQTTVWLRWCFTETNTVKPHRDGLND